jgi:hypothetical protein
VKAGDAVIAKPTAPRRVRERLAKAAVLVRRIDAYPSTHVKIGLFAGRPAWLVINDHGMRWVSEDHVEVVD